MRKVLVAILCLFLLGACSRGNEEGQPEVSGSRLALGVRSVDSMIITGMPAAVCELTGGPVGGSFEMNYFEAGEEIVYQDLQPGEHTFLVLGNVMEEDECELFINSYAPKDIQFRWRNGGRLPELFGGLIKVDGASEKMTVEMLRLVGELKVNVVNPSEFVRMDVRLDMQCYYEVEPILLGDYSLMPEMYSSDLEVGESFYLFPTKKAVFGEIIVWDENWNEYRFGFEAKNCIQRNKKLELNLTLNKATAQARSLEAVNTVICEETVSDL